jgi:aminoglycoside 3-N-acetyltransferase
MNLSIEFEKELTSCLADIGLSQGDNIYVTGNIGALGRVRINKTLKMDLLLKAFQNNIGREGTIFSTAASMNLCNTKIPFDIDKTPAHQMGAFAEYFRQLPNAVRTNHPFWSICGLGNNANKLKRVSRHAYGAGSPWSIFLELNTTQVNIGLHPSKAVTLIHHIETVVGVPYRYTKEFVHPIVHGNEIKEELFYQLVMYRDSSIRKKIALNEHFFSELELKGLLNQTQHSSGLKFWSFKMTDFYKIALEFFIDDIYTYLEEPPPVRPYSK